MPEKPKRRKNNKNKRKNKNNNRPDLNKNCSDSKESIDVETCSANDVSCDDSNTTEGKSESELTALSNEKTEEPNQTSVDIKIDSVLSNVESSNICNKNEVVTEIQKEMGTDLQDTSCIISVTKTDNQDNEVFSEIEISENYVVESPDQSIKTKSKKKKSKLSNVKSKSLDNDDAPKIIEITDDGNTHFEDDNNLAIIDSNVLVSDVDSDVEWEKTDDMHQSEQAQSKKLATGKISVTSIPLEVAQCEQTKSLTPEEEMSLRHYLHTLNLATHPPNANSIEIKTEIEQIINREIRHRLRKKGLAEDVFTQRLGPPRILDVIDEEGSSESSITSRRQSYLSDKKSDNEDLEDDVFEDPKKVREKYSTKSIDTLSNRTLGRLVPQQCVLVGAKLKEPDITEARGDWTVKTVEKMTGAEVVYLTDSSSSTSSIYDVGEETNDGGETDASVRMITPTIEVTDTENLLKKTFISNNRHEQLRENETELTEITIHPLEKSTHISKENKIDVDENINDCHTENNHEIVVLSTDNIRTNLYVKGINEVNKTSDYNVSNSNNNVADSSFVLNTSVISEPKKEKKAEKEIEPEEQNAEKDSTDYNLEIKVLKCELNDAINNLIKEVVSDSETNNDSKDTFTRQDSSSSVCSSQCTAKYNPTYSSLNDVSNILHDETCETSKIITENTHSTASTSHVKDVFECVTGISTNNKSKIVAIHPLALRDLCVRKIATFPYGDKILEELASVSERLQNITALGKSLNENSRTQNQEAVVETVINKQEHETDNKPYIALPDLSSIEPISLPIKQKDVEPPPIQPRNSSLKKSQDDHHWSALPTKTEPVYVCLSPSQKMLMEKTNTVITKEDTSQLVDTHKKFVDRRGYNEYYDEDNKREKDVVDNIPVVPFKSQTGSRLLALIRDPSVTCNINSSMNKHKSLDQLQQNYTRTDTMPQNSDLGQISISTDLSNTFKPIPPPRPRKFSSSFYESDESSNFTDNSFRALRSERKFFHYSTGNLNKEIENDISSIQNMHRHYTNVRDQLFKQNYPRRPSLPKDLCDQQMEYIRQKEKEVEAELRRLEDQKSKLHNIQRRGPRAPLISEKEIIEEKITDANNYYISRKKDVSFNTKPSGKEEKSKLSSLFSSSQEEILRDKMYTEYINQIAERQERKQQKIIKITNTPNTVNLKTVSKSMPALDILDSKVNNRIEKEFISKARERWNKLGITDPETEDEKDENRKNIYKEPKVIEHKIKVIEGDEVKDFQKLPNHLQEFVSFAAKDKAHKSNSPGESKSGPASPHVVILCAVFIIVIAVGKYFLRLLRNK